eukprot:CAMPEP_0184861992 /NCGR_PEP_ID=MMETSP0580-20130426/6540_1 /TAXON_ID=1118495 /ORGANISM="Dactyliosolen fragilissimus" /LENGTH=614 /DNA_ID=CAMNT_0027359679 /DNA_START=302 /DNA_END=2146 /DNA_ORIENTATION=-
MVTDAQARRRRLIFSNNNIAFDNSFSNIATQLKLRQEEDHDDDNDDAAKDCHERGRYDGTAIESENTSTSSNSKFTEEPMHLDDKIREVDIYDYLSSVEEELERHGPTFRVRVRQPNRRPMIRTLLGLNDKVEFDKLVRLTKHSTEFRKMKTFVLRHLCPLLNMQINHEITNRLNTTFETKHNNSKDGDYTNIIEKVPHLPKVIEETLSLDPSRGTYPFNRLGSGKEFRGNVELMLQTIAPQILDEYRKASEPLTEVEVLHQVIHHRAQQINLSRNKLDAAIECLHQYSTGGKFISSSPQLDECSDNGDDSDTHLIHDDPSKEENIGIKIGKVGQKGVAKMNGVMCEQACIAHLEERIRLLSSFPTTSSSSSLSSHNKTVVLRNVFINHKDTCNRRKYSNHHINNKYGGNHYSQSIRSSSNLRDDDAFTTAKQNSESEPTGIIWTELARQGKCSEFDAVVFNQDNGRISEIWEAKYSLSPSSLYDAISKKLSAYRNIVQDSTATIQTLGNIDNTMNLTKHDKLSFGQTNNGNNAPIFGIFGMDLLPPANSVSQLKAIAVANILGSDEDMVISAIKHGYVEVSINKAKKDLINLRELLYDKAEGYRVVIRIASVN